MTLVDLGRNDIGRVSEIGSVTIDKYMKVEKYSHVMHIVSEVYGTLQKQMGGFDALAYCLPAGTVSGAPKIRAMEIINELENEKEMYTLVQLDTLVFQEILIWRSPFERWS